MSKKKKFDTVPFIRAEDEAQTRDPQLGRLMLYQLSYFRRGCGRRWIRTTEDVRQQIYSLPHLATLVFARPKCGCKDIYIFFLRKQIRYFFNTKIFRHAIPHSLTGHSGNDRRAAKIYRRGAPEIIDQALSFSESNVNWSRMVLASRKSTKCGATYSSTFSFLSAQRKQDINATAWSHVK